MNATLAFLGALVVGLIVWLLWRHQRARSAFTEREEILKELAEIERKRQALIDEAGHRGLTISTDKALKRVEELRDSYVISGNDTAAREVDQMIRKLREENGPEIPIEKAYALMRDLDGKHG